MTVSKTEVLASLSAHLPETDVERLLTSAVKQAGLSSRAAYAPDEVSAIAQAILTLAGRELADAEPAGSPVPTLS